MMSATLPRLLGFGATFTCSPTTPRRGFGSPTWVFPIRPVESPELVCPMEPPELRAPPELVRAVDRRLWPFLTLPPRREPFINESLRLLW